MSDVPAFGHSPLFLVSRDPRIDRLVRYLDVSRRALMESPGGEQVLRFSRLELNEVRDAFAAMIRRGEARLHQLSALLCGALFESGWEMESVVIGGVESTGERFTLAQNLSPNELGAFTDLDLGNRMLRRFLYHDGQRWARPVLISNVVEYQPLSLGRHGIHKLISRIKAEEEIWNKVVDEIFGLDSLVQRDKQLRGLSRYVKDIFGLKLVVGDDAAARALQGELRAVQFGEVELERLGVPISEDTRALSFIEVKDYLDDEQRKRSGWAALKSVVHWRERPFEIQVQPLPNYLRELDRLTRESHSSFKLQRDALRDRVAQQVPLFGFYRDLLRWLFLSPEEPVPAHEGVRIEVTE